MESNTDAPAELLALASIEGNFMFDPATHRDFLGAVLNTGVDRRKLGDIIMQGESGAQMLLVPELLEFFQGALTTVRSVPVTVHPAELSALNVKPPKVDTIRTTEASLRLDAVASAGLRMPRSKCAAAIAAGDVKVNWREVTKASKDVKQGDIISCRGKGRLEIGSVSMNSKGRYSVEMTRYV